MQLHTLKRRHKRIRSVVVGRGGKRGKTSGRGGKGQTARAGHKIRPEIRDLIKKLPKRRGHGKNRSRTVRPKVALVPVNLAALEAKFSAGEEVSRVTLAKKGIIRRVGRRAPAVKILGTGELTKALTVKGCVVSAAAAAAIEKAGGTVTHD
ncbi:MAG: uL15 family ribosomal protein [Patescibacteria group bacterium]|nr:uL15 family ribosomal protein [Patescibacteria group bacterium]MDE1966328.1 uL15 family ribosomal protein [Patescibacteria group bacterium]